MVATHSGHCQICGRLHKVTGVRIAKHGYTLQYGWQMGACFGSGRRPYELANDALLDAIQSAGRFIGDTQQLIERMRADPLDEHGMVWAYAWRGHEKQITNVSIDTGLEGRLEFRDFTGKVIKLYDPVRATTIDGAARELANRRIKALAHLIQQSEASIVFMQERHDTWKPGQLIPVPHLQEAPAAPTVHFQVKRYGYTTTACSASASGAQRNTGKNKTSAASDVTCVRCAKEAARLAAKGLIAAAT